MLGPLGGWGHASPAAVRANLSTFAVTCDCDCNPRSARCLLLLLQERHPVRNGLLSNTWKWTSRGDTRAYKAKDLIGMACPDGEQCGKGNQETCSAVWLTVSGIMLMGWVSEFSLAGHLVLIWLRVLPGGACSSQPRQIPVQRILGVW